MLLGLLNMLSRSSLSRSKSESQQIKYPRPDGVITFDRLTNVSYSSTYHEENQSCHLTLNDQRYQFQIIMNS